MAVIPEVLRYGVQDPVLRAWLEYAELYYFRDYLAGPAPRRLPPFSRGVSTRGKGKTPATEKADGPSPAERREKERALWQMTKLPSSEDCRTGLQSFVRETGVNRFETRILIVSLYKTLCEEWSGGNHFISHCVDPLSLLGAGPKVALRNHYFIGPPSRLFQKGLLSLSGSPIDPRVEISPRAFAMIMGERRAEKPERGPTRPPQENAVDNLKPRVTLGDVVLPASTREQLEDALYFINARENVLAEAGLSDVIEKGTGVTLLFWGPPGTGKSMAAEAVAGELGKEASIVRPDQVESQYFGGTEKNIARLFKVAAEQDLVLVFDECDSLFFSRPNGPAYQSAIVSRCVNMLLRGLEEGKGVYILTTNRPEALDAALQRRLAAKIEFGLPDAPARLELWRRLLPRNHAISDEGVEALAAKYALTGGVIKQTVLTGLRRAAREKRQLTLADLEPALTGLERVQRPIGF